jgi:hypothetical protein
VSYLRKEALDLVVVGKKDWTVFIVYKVRTISLIFVIHSSFNDEGILFYHRYI